MENIRSDIYKVLISIVVLFILYHSAEYAIVFKNNVILFFVFQFLFFLSAWILGNWNKKNGFRFWGLSPTQLRVKYVLIGITSGVILYAIPFIISLSLGVETITKIPNWIDIIKFSIPFSFGVLFTSFSEDVLTRGTVFGLFNNKLKPVWIILISSLLYLLNHIYRLNDGFETLSYIFLLGVLFIIPVIITKNLWICNQQINLPIFSQTGFLIFSQLSVPSGCRFVKYSFSVIHSIASPFKFNNFALI